MLKFYLSIILIVTESLFASTFNDSAGTNYSDLDDSVKISMMLDTVWVQRSNNPLEAIKIAKSAAALSKEINNQSLLAKSNNFLGVIHSNLGAFELALDYHTDALNLSKTGRDKTQEAYSYNNIGGIYLSKNEYVKASENILKAVFLFEELNDTTGLIYCYINMGTVYKDQNNIKKSQDYFNLALNLSNSIDSEYLSGRILLEIADILLKRNLNKESEKIFLKLEKLYSKIDYLKGLAEVWMGLSSLHMKNNDFNKALEFSNKALNLNRKILNPVGEVNSLNRFAIIYMQKNNFKKSKEFLSLALKKSAEIKEADPIINTYKIHYDFFKKTGDLKNALFYYEKYHIFKDSVYTRDKMLKFSELESLLRNEKTEKENQILQNNLEQQIIQKNYLISFIILSLIMVVTISFRFYEKKKLNEELKKTNIIKDKFFSIIAHDLREPYNAIFNAIELLRNRYYNLTEKEKEESIETIGRLIKTDFDLLENLLMWAKNQGSSIEFNPEEIKLCDSIKNTISLFQNNIDRKQISSKIDCKETIKIYADKQMLNSILRNLIFNSIKFSNKGGNIDIRAAVNDADTTIVVEDNGTGMDSGTMNNLFNLENKRSNKGTEGESGSGLGLIITKEFVEAHKGTIEVESNLEEGSRFTITFPNISSTSQKIE